jgi:hypothetical protein
MFAVNVSSTSAPWYLGVDDFRLETTPSCVAPTTLTSGSITASGATVSWPAPTTAPANGYDIYYSTTNTAPTATTTPSATVAAGVTTYNISDLPLIQLIMYGCVLIAVPDLQVLGQVLLSFTTACTCYKCSLYRILKV